MADFTESENFQLCTILRVNRDLLNMRVGYLGARYSEDLRTAVRLELARYTDAVKGNFVKVHPLNSNKGVEINPDGIKDDIRANIAVLLEFEGYDYNSNSFEFQIVKG